MDDHFFWSFWWLIFPIGFFVFGAFDRWLAYRRSQDRMDLIRSYANQGKDPPPELLKALQSEEELEEPGPYEGRRSRRALRYAYRNSPYRMWRSAIVTGSIAVGFWVAAELAYVPGADGPFRLVAVILGCVTLANLALALMATTFRNK